MVLFGLNFGQNRPFFALQKSNFGFAFENERTVRTDFPILEKATLRQSRASSLDTPQKSCHNGEKAIEDTPDDPKLTTNRSGFRREERRNHG